MLNVTIEWNAVMAKADDDKDRVPFIDELVSMHGSEIDLGIVTTAASENTKKRELPANATKFVRRLEGLNWGHLSKVRTLGVYSLTYFDFCRYAGENSQEVVQKLWSVIDPNEKIPRDRKEFAKKKGFDPSTPLGHPAFSKWRNQWCDVYSLEAHIAAERDLFVSGDEKNFKGEKYDQLLALGVGEICGYKDAANKIHQMSGK